MGKRQRETDTR